MNAAVTGRGALVPNRASARAWCRNSTIRRLFERAYGVELVKQLYVQLKVDAVGNGSEAT